MNAKGRAMFSRIAILTSSVALLLIAAGPAMADAIPPNFLTTEMMMENLGVNVQGIGRLLGIDEGAGLSATTNTDPDNLAFSFALDPGQSYNGTAVTLTGGGAYNPAQSRWEGHAVAGAGRASLFTADWIGNVISTDPYVCDYQWIAQLGTRTEIDAEGKLKFGTDEDGGIWSSGDGELTIDGDAWFTVHGEDHIPWWALPWNWFSIAEPLGPGTPFQTIMNGYSLENGGSGTAYGQIDVIPEPASLVLLATGLLLGFGRRR
jgi:hypothetical protein